MSDKELKSLVCQRSKIKSNLTRANTLYTNTNIGRVTENVYNKLKVRLLEIVPLLEKFNEIMDQIETLDEDNMETHNTERENFEIAYEDVVSKYETFLEDTTPESSNSSSSIDSIRSSPLNVKLPVLTLPNFNGDYEQWESFSETFKSLIHDNESIDNIQKYHYLKSCLSGNALNTIKSLTITSSNYETAWKLLTERFENKSIIVDKHLKSIFDIPSVSKDSHMSLRALLNGVQSNLRALSNLGLPVKEWDVIISFIIKNKLDYNTRSEWEFQNTSREINKFDSLLEFLKRKCDMLESLRPEKMQNSSKFNQNYKQHKSSNVSTNKQNTKFLCNFCSGSHTILSCSKFNDLTPNERFSKARENNLCTNCLNKGHSNKQCRSNYNCRFCQKRHHSLLHIEINSEINEPSLSTSNHLVFNSNHTILSTACVNVIDTHGRNHNCRVLLDSGSQSNFITKRMCRLLDVPLTDINMSITGVNQSISQIKHKATIKFKSNNSSFQTKLSCLVLDKITDRLPQFSFNTNMLEIPKNIRLADPTFNRNGEIDMLIGADIFWNLICVGQITLGKNFPTLQKTRLGWVVAGPIPFKSDQASLSSNLSINNNFELSKFWEIEEIVNTSPYTREENLCENNFIETTKRHTDGRFMVTLPFRENINQLGNSRQIAFNRFLSLERKFCKNLSLRDSYVKFMIEYEQLGHMTEVNPSQPKPSLVFYLPHHPVFKEDSSSTKLRVVFDGSAHSDSELSLNSTLMVGPTIQRDLFSILLRFRRFKYALSADITKMYRQVLVAPENRSLQRILWRKSPDDKIREFELNTITYGTASASFLAIRCLKQLSIDNKSDFPEASFVIENDFYVDDLLTGGNKIEDVIRLRKDITMILASAGFELRKWLSNHTSVLPNVPISNGNSCLTISDSPEIKTLGLLWDSNSDSFRYENKVLKNTRISKRTILSFIGQLFDPLGLLAPIIITAKLIMQSLWQLKINWDESLPIEMHSRWLKFVHSLEYLNQIKASRRIFCDSPKEIELHGFCDASKVAYGACVYVKSTNASGNVKINLLCAKSKVAPLKQISIPRLELCGALLLSELINKIRSCLDIKITTEYYWCDSTIVLHWLNSPSNRWKTFVANRVSQIQEQTHRGKWLHVKTLDNPADLITRGIDSKELINHKLWWSGPPYIKLASDMWPKIELDSTMDNSEQRKLLTCAVSTNSVLDFNLFSKYSEYNKLLRVITYCIRFISNCKRFNKNKLSGPLSVCELKSGSIMLLKSAQAKYFSNEINDLKGKKPLNNRSSILALNPFLDGEGLLRVGGRLNNANYTFDQKHPIILHSKHLLTRLILEREHRIQLHCGSQTLLASVRCKYWPISGRNLCKNIVRNCITCFKSNPAKQMHIMGDLPKERVIPTAPFQTCGVDYAGPFLIKDRKGRGAKVSKAYLCIFICFSIKALHLELVSDLTAEAFIASFRRFCYRRGKPHEVYSDNGSNFIGAHNELNELKRFIQSDQNKEYIIEKASNLEISWHFIPPRSPHFGGLWEAGVKSVKGILKRVVGNAHLTFEELSTYLIQVEGILNSRPLTPISTDPNDCTPLTPAHFLIGRLLIGPPDPNVTHIPEARLSRFQRIQQLTQHFWKRWSKEYLGELQRRSKWKRDSGKLLRIGDLVLLKEESAMTSQWRLGRIQATHPGADGVVRVVTVKTPTSVLKRSVMSLCALPIDYD